MIGVSVQEIPTDLVDLKPFRAAAAPLALTYGAAVLASLGLWYLVFTAALWVAQGLV